MNFVEKRGQGGLFKVEGDLEIQREKEMGDESLSGGLVERDGTIPFGNGRGEEELMVRVLEERRGQWEKCERTFVWKLPHVDVDAEGLGGTVEEMGLTEEESKARVFRVGLDGGEDGEVEVEGGEVVEEVAADVLCITQKDGEAGNLLSLLKIELILYLHCQKINGGVVLLDVLINVHVVVSVLLGFVYIVVYIFVKFVICDIMTEVWRISMVSLEHLAYVVRKWLAFFLSPKNLLAFQVDRKKRFL